MQTTVIAAMMLSRGALESLHILLLFGFIAASSLLLVVTVLNRQRVSGVLLSFPTGRFFGIPATPVVFLTAVVCLLVFSAARGQVAQNVVFAGYVVGGLFWLTARLLSTSVIVSKHGIISRLNQGDGALAWGQIRDYFCSRGRRRDRYVFFFVDEEGVRRRFELSVPRAYGAEFAAIVQEMLDARFEVRRRARRDKKMEDH